MNAPHEAQITLKNAPKQEREGPGCISGIWSFQKASFGGDLLGRHTWLYGRLLPASAEGERQGRGSASFCTPSNGVLPAHRLLHAFPSAEKVIVTVRHIPFSSLPALGKFSHSRGPSLSDTWESEEALESPFLDRHFRLCLTHNCLPAFALNSPGLTPAFGW